MAAVEYARSGRSSCSCCGERIAVDSVRFKVARKWHCVECFAQSGKRSERSVDGADDLSIDDQRIVSELRKRSRSASALQQEAEELRAVRQCVREWSKNYGECETKKDKG
eukprot:g15361.t1